MPDVMNNLQTNAEFMHYQQKRESKARSYPFRLPIAIRRAKGIYVEDVDGRTYYDCLSGAGTLALGHHHPEVVAAMKKLLDENRPLHTLDLATPIKQQFMEEVFSVLPKGFAERAKIHFCGPTGADAVEAALKLVKTATGNETILSFYGGYHGATHATMALSGNVKPKATIGGFLSAVHHFPYPYSYRCPFALGGKKGATQAAQFVRNVLEDPENGLRPPAGMIFEVVQGEGGSIPAPDHWVKEMRKLTKEHGIPLIIDEIQTGLGRTGKWFAFEHAGICPDVVVLSKAIGGSLPLSLIVYDKALDRWQPGAHIGTFRGNQMAMAAGMATIRVIRENGLQERAKEIGQKMIGLLREAERKSTVIGDVRGRGLMIGVEIVDKRKEADKTGAYPPWPEMAAAIQRQCLENGLIVETGGRFGAVIRFLPPLTITEKEAENVCRLFARAVYYAENEAGQRI